MKNKKVRIFNIILFIVVLLLTIHLVFKMNDINLFIKNIKNINIIYFFLAFIFMFFYLVLDGLNVGIVLKSLNIKTKILKLFKYSCVNFFFSGITPSSTGGEPMKLYAMNQDGISISKSALSVLVSLASFLFITCILGVVGVFLNFNTLFNRVGFAKYLVILGFLVNILYMIIILIITFNKKIALKLINIVTKILNRFSLKNRENIINKLEKQINDYHECSIYIKKNKKVLIKILLTTLLELTIYHTIPYLICLSFGIKGINPLKIITMSAVLHVSVSFLPFPGAMGANEGGFMALYRFYVKSSYLPSIMIITRMINYYIFIILTSIVVLISIIRKR